MALLVLAVGRAVWSVTPTTAAASSSDPWPLSFDAILTSRPGTTVSIRRTSLCT